MRDVQESQVDLIDESGSDQEVIVNERRRVIFMDDANPRVLHVVDHASTRTCLWPVSGVCVCLRVSVLLVLRACCCCLTCNRSRHSLRQANLPDEVADRSFEKRLLLKRFVVQQLYD